ncbi:acetate--CoA ligase [bacterium]|nr:acetate--CoA ligase [bacterium]
MKDFYPVLPQWSARAHITKEEYARLYTESVNDPDGFWGRMGEELLWRERWKNVCQADFVEGNIRWFDGGSLNVAENCLDVHLKLRGEKLAIIWEGDEPGLVRRITYRELHGMVCQAANLLESLGVKAGDRVTIYMPMIPEAAVAMLACARIGATHSVVFGGFSPHALRGRIEDAASDFIITSDEGLRGGKTVPLKANVDEAIEGLTIRHVLVVKRTGADVPWKEGRDLWWHDTVEKQPAAHEARAFDAEHPLFILYTSGSTGKPKGVLHSSAGYLLYTMLTHRYVFDYHEEDIYWCTADVGWVTGHSYIVYGPLANGATSLMFEGVPSYPNASRFWDVIDRHQVTQFYTAPTAIRALMREGDHWVKKHSLDTLRVLGTVGEPINPEVWRWYYDVVGERRCPIVDTWWQTETGGHLITPMPGATDLKPGSASLPFFGVQPGLLDEKGKEVAGAGEGALCIKASWPGQARTVYGDHKRFKETYFGAFPGYYFSGDGARRDEDGYYWITGRMDDVLNVSGHRLGTAEIESSLVAHADVAEAAVVGFPHDIKGEGIHAYVMLNPGIAGDAAKADELKKWVRKDLSAIAAPDRIQFAEGLPKTRSGKIMRRILRKIAHRELDGLGDVSTLLNPEAVEQLKKGIVL